MLTDAQYIAKQGGVCPVCGSDELEGQSVNIDGGCVFQEISCNDCEAEWTDMYKLVGYEMLRRDEAGVKDPDPNDNHG